MLKDQLTRFRPWLTSPINFERQGKCLDNSTVDRVEINITCYLGYCHTFQGVAEPTFAACYHVVMLLAYFSFLVWRGTAGHTFDSLFNSIKWVVTFLKAPLRDPEVDQVGVQSPLSSCTWKTVFLIMWLAGVGQLAGLAAPVCEAAADKCSSKEPQIIQVTAHSFSHDWLPG